jgi:hypothetical protein
MQQMVKSNLKCSNCQITIRWLPVLFEGKPYCCAGCSEGGPCSCDYSRLPETEVRYAIVLHHLENIVYIRS